ncbi:hypothetical protein Pfo_021228 [Paulownia fortunei]|nr:hypothetical protein Pfo_021228 [Paulownia fortunei]
MGWQRLVDLNANIKFDGWWEVTCYCLRFQESIKQKNFNVLSFSINIREILCKSINCSLCVGKILPKPFSPLSFLFVSLCVRARAQDPLSFLIRHPHKKGPSAGFPWKFWQICCFWYITGVISYVYHALLDLNRSIKLPVC